MDHSYIIAFWSPFPTPMTNFCKKYFTPFFKNYGDIQCLDCSTRSDRRTKRLMHQADLVAIIIRQSYTEICRLFCRNLLSYPNCIYIITDYVPGWGFDLKNIAYEFRIPSAQLGCIPYCLGLCDDFRATVKDYCYMNFDLELNRTGQKMLKALGF